MPTKRFQFVGGSLCLDFANTVGGTRGGGAREYLNGYADFASWCRQAGLLSPAQAVNLIQQEPRRATDSGVALKRAVVLREAIYRIFSAIAWRKTPADPDLEQLNAELAQAHGRLRVKRRRNGFDWEWTDGDGVLEHPLGPIALSAAELLTDKELLARVRQCGSDDCDWVFLDLSKNHSRRWCVMRECGNVAKVRRFRQRQRRGPVSK